MTNIVQTAGTVAVGSSAVLGCCFVVCVIMLLILWVCLVETLLSMVADKTEQKLDDLKRTQNNEDNGKKSKMACELNQSLGLLNEAICAGDELLGCPLGRLGDENINASLSQVIQFRAGAYRNAMKKFLKLSWVCLCANPFLDFWNVASLQKFWNGRAHKQPNEKS